MHGLFPVSAKFFRCALPSQNKYILAPKVPLKNFWGWSAKTGFLKKYQRGDPLSRQGVEFALLYQNATKLLSEYVRFLCLLLKVETIALEPAQKFHG